MGNLPLTEKSLCTENRMWVSRQHMWKISSQSHASCSWIDWNGCWETRSSWLRGKELYNRFVMSAVEQEGERGGEATQSPKLQGRPASQISVQGAGAQPRGRPAKSRLVVLVVVLLVEGVAVSGKV